MMTSSSLILIIAFVLVLDATGFVNKYLHRDGPKGLMTRNQQNYYNGNPITFTLLQASEAPQQSPKAPTPRSQRKAIKSKERQKLNQKVETVAVTKSSPPSILAGNSPTKVVVPKVKQIQPKKNTIEEPLPMPAVPQMKTDIVQPIPAVGRSKTISQPIPVKPLNEMEPVVQLKKVPDSITTLKTVSVDIIDQNPEPATTTKMVKEKKKTTSKSKTKKATTKGRKSTLPKKKVVKMTKRELKKQERNQRALLKARIKYDSIMLKRQKALLLAKEVTTGSTSANSTRTSKGVTKKNKVSSSSSSSSVTSILTEELPIRSENTAVVPDIVIVPTTEMDVSSKKKKSTQRSSKGPNKNVVDVVEEKAKDEKIVVDSKKMVPITTNTNLNSDKYASIEDLGERAFAILSDIGMIDKYVDPSSPEYDSSRDDEFAPENVFLNFPPLKDMDDDSNNNKKNKKQ